MKLSFASASPTAVKSDVLAFFFHQENGIQNKERSVLAKKLGSRMLLPFDTGDFKGKKEEAVTPQDSRQATLEAPCGSLCAASVLIVDR